jgi:hypothetical protein
VFLWCTCEHQDIAKLSFEEGTTHIGSLAFFSCNLLESVSLPATPVIIGAVAFAYCSVLREVTFAAGSQLQSIQGKAFLDVSLEEVTLPSSATEIDLSAFSAAVWRIVKFDHRRRSLFRRFAADATVHFSGSDAHDTVEH